MNDRLHIKNADGIMEVTLTHPPLNILDVPMRKALWEAVEQLEANETLFGMILRAEGQVFSAGADIAEFEGLKPPTLPRLLDRIEDSTKPVLLLIEGLALGGAVEMALAAHYRILGRSAALGLPEIKLGLLPGAGGTQRLPRLIGAEPALEIMASGRNVDSKRALQLGLVDQVVEGETLEGARQFLSDRRNDAPPRTRNRISQFRDPTAYLKDCQIWRTALGDREPAALQRIVECVEGALLLPFEAGLGMESVAFSDCLASESSRCLRHIFFAERKMGRFAKGQGIEPVKSISIIGGGNVGRYFARCALRSGISVELIERDGFELEKSLRSIDAALVNDVAKGRLSADARVKALDRLKGTQGTGSFVDAGLVLECLPNNADQKAQVLGVAAGLARPGTIFVSSATFLDGDRVFSRVPSEVPTLFVHPIAPVGHCAFAEVIQRPATSPKDAKTLAATLKKMQIRSIVTSDFVLLRLKEALRLCAEDLVHRGSDPLSVDQALAGMGWSGVFRGVDREGIEFGSGLRQHMRQGAGFLEVLRQGGHRQVFDWKDGKPTTSEATSRAIMQVRLEERISVRDLAKRDIVKALMDALYFEGARILSDGAAETAEDIDAAMVHGLNFPRLLGGAMAQGDLHLFGQLSRTAEVAAGASTYPEIAPMLAERLATGETFTGI